VPVLVPAVAPAQPQVGPPAPPAEQTLELPPLHLGNDKTIPYLLHTLEMKRLISTSTMLGNDMPNPAQRLA